MLEFVSRSKVSLLEPARHCSCRADRLNKGVVYTGDASGYSPVDVLADSNAAQCAIDAPMLKDLGANTVSVTYVDGAQSHDKCMQTLADNGIYVIANMATQDDYATQNMTGREISSNLVSPVVLFPAPGY